MGYKLWAEYGREVLLCVSKEGQVLVLDINGRQDQLYVVLFVRSAMQLSSYLKRKKEKQRNEGEKQSNLETHPVAISSHRSNFTDQA